MKSTVGRLARAARLSALFALLHSTLHVAAAHASGLYVTDRGVRPLGRGGAFVAGADDLGAVSYNPAGLADAGSGFLLDAAWLDFRATYARRMRVLDASGRAGEQDLGTVSGTTPFLPIPTVAASFAPLRDEPLVVALGVYAPYAPLTRYPESVGGVPAPSRYSLVSLEGSALLVAGGWVAYRPVRALRIGMGFQALVGSLATRVALNTNPGDRTLGAAEDPQYDALTDVRIGPIFAPSFSVGATFEPARGVRIGLSAQAPFVVDARARVTVRLPGAPVFENARQEGEDARARFRLPAILRAGVEVRPMEALRIELAYVRELWSVHRAITIDPVDLNLRGITAFPSPFRVAPLSIPRGFDDAHSIRLGGEYALRVGGVGVDARAGASFDTSAVPRAYVSPLTVDADKLTLTLGAGLHVGRSVRIDAVYAHVFFAETTVAPEEAAVPRVNPVRGNPVRAEGINGGTYTARANVVGLGVSYRF